MRKVVITAIILICLLFAIAVFPRYHHFAVTGLTDVKVVFEVRDIDTLDPIKDAMILINTQSARIPDRGQEPTVLKTDSEGVAFLFASEVRWIAENNYFIIASSRRLYTPYWGLKIFAKDYAVTRWRTLAAYDSQTAWKRSNQAELRVDILLTSHPWKSGHPLVPIGSFK